MNKDNSSSKKKSQFEIPSGIIRTGKILQFFSTSAAAKFALKLFGSPPKFKTPEREIMMQKSAKNEMVLVPAINKEVMLYTYGYSKTKVLMAHGWSGRGTQLYELADKLLENGMMVYSFDAPAHGLSEGKTTDFPECVATIEFLNEKYGPFEAAIGHSFGGITLMSALAKNAFVKKLVTIGIDSSINNIVDEFVKKLKLKQKVAVQLKKKMANKYKGDIETAAAEVTAHKISVPTLVIHDTEDLDVDVSSAFKIRQNLEQGNLLVTKGLGHRRIFRDPKVIQKIIAFIKT